MPQSVSIGMGERTPSTLSRVLLLPVLVEPRFGDCWVRCFTRVRLSSGSLGTIGVGAKGE